MAGATKATKKRPGRPAKADGRDARVMVRVSIAWHAVIKRQAAAKCQPIAWYLIGLIMKDAKERGETDIPPAPWE